MSVIVQKYGGSSLADIEKLKIIAGMIATVKKNGNDVVAVVSAMGKTTNSLISLAKEISPNPSKREMDMLLSTGERTTMALLCIALNELGIEAISLTGSQAGIITNDRHNDASVIEVRPVRVQDELEKGKVIVIGGFQGALAAALNAERCEIYSDVDGVYSADPNMVKNAEHLPEVSYQQIQEMAEAGAKVLNAQAVQFVKDAKITLYARSTFSPGRETIIGELSSKDKPGVIAVVYESEITRFIYKSENMNESFPELFKFLESKDIPVKELNLVDDEQTSFSKASFIISKSNVHGWDNVNKELNEKFGDDLDVDHSFGTVSIIGEGFSKDNRVMTETLDLLQNNSIRYYGLATTSFRLSLLIKQEIIKDTVKLLHNYWIGT
jgi:aspartate kinase